MDATMPDYINALSTSYDILEKIFEKKYKKFRSLYWMIKKYNKDTVSLEYNDSDDAVLCINMIVSKDKGKDISKSLKEESDNDSVDISCKKDKIQITIIK